LPSRRAISPLPGFGLTLGFTLTYLGLLVLLPLGALAFKAAGAGPATIWATLSAPRAVAALSLSVVSAFVAAAINAVFGLILAWVLVRYRPAGAKILDAAIDLPFALPTAVAGIALTSSYASDGIIGGPLSALGIQGAYSRFGIVVALIFVGLPFVVRTVQPVLENLDEQLEDAAALLGATRMQTLVRVVLPSLIPAIATGFSLAFARALGEYGSVVFIAGNMPMKTEIAPLLIMTKLEQFDYEGAAALGVAMLVASFAILLLINGLQVRSRRRSLRGGGGGKV
jgi:sulfate transport system permease protein